MTFRNVKHAPSHVAAPPARAATGRILVVDDIKSNRDLLVTVLEHYGHSVVEADDGDTALAAVRADLPDLIITDVLMPVMDGFELLRQLRLDPATAAIPVVFCTAHYGEREGRALAMASGVSHVLTKPLDSAEMLEVVTRLLAPSTKMAQLPDAAPLSPEFDRKHLRLLTDKLSQKVDDVMAANGRLRALINIEIELASEANPAIRLHNVCAAASDLFGATYTSIGIVDRTSLRLTELSGCDSEPPWMATGEPAPGIIGRTLAERRTFRGNNPRGDPGSLGLPPNHPMSGHLLSRRSPR